MVFFLFFNSHFLAAGDVKAPVAGGEEDDDEVPGQYVALNPPPTPNYLFFLTIIFHILSPSINHKIICLHFLLFLVYFICLLVWASQLLPYGFLCVW